MSVPTALEEARRQWRALLQILQSMEEHCLQWQGPGGETLDGQDAAEAYRYLLHNLRYGIDFMIESDPARPHFVPMADDITKIFGDNRDALYKYTHISGAGGARYRITGKRGDACYLSFQSHRGDDRGNPFQLTIDSLNMQRIDFAADGGFSVLVGGPAQPRNWLQLDENATCILAREYYFGLPDDRTAHYRIEALDEPGAPGPWNPAAMAARLADLTTYMNSIRVMGPAQVQAWNVYSAPLQFTKDIPAWGTPDNQYSSCYYRLTGDEALVIEGRGVPAVYWGFQLWNIFTQTMDFRYHNTSLNSRNIQLNADGSYRAVVAHRDPGVPNWLDTGGHRIGSVFCRWLCAGEQPVPPTVRVVKMPATGSLFE